MAKLKREFKTRAADKKRVPKTAMRHKAAITAANNAVRREKIKRKNRAKNRVARKSRRINRRHKR